MPPALPPESDRATCAVPDTQALRCTGVEPNDGPMVADSPTNRTVTTVPSDSVLVISPPERATTVSAIGSSSGEQAQCHGSCSTDTTKTCTMFMVDHDSSRGIEFASISPTVDADAVDCDRG